MASSNDWFVGGLPSAGKSTVAATLERELRLQGRRARIIHTDRWIRDHDDRLALASFDMAGLKTTVAKAAERAKAQSVTLMLPGGQLEIKLASDEVLIWEGVFAAELAASVGRTAHAINVVSSEAARHERFMHLCERRGIAPARAKTLFIRAREDQVPETSTRSPVQINLDACQIQSMLAKETGMIISRTPLRMSFVGGGSDLPSYYREHGGAVVSTAIDKYVYVTMNRKFDSGIRVAYSRVEEVNSVSEIEHQLVRAALNMAGVPGGVEITTVADIPSRGTGLGSSSSFTVALLHALYALLGRHSTRQELAEQACHVEIDVCGEPIGKQDQYAAAYGGFNLYEFNQNDTVTVSPVICKPETIAGIRKQMLVLYTGITRGASTILKHQSAELATNTDKKSAMKRMVALCYQLLKEIRNDNLDSFGQVLHEAWMLKRDMAPGVSTSDIDDWYDTARKHGAIGGKILGAGAGGFLALFAPEDRHEAIRHALPKLRAIPVDFERTGKPDYFLPADVEHSAGQRTANLLTPRSRRQAERPSHKNLWDPHQDCA